MRRRGVPLRRPVGPQGRHDARGRRVRGVAGRRRHARRALHRAGGAHHRAHGKARRALQRRRLLGQPAGPARRAAAEWAGFIGRFRPADGRFVGGRARSAALTRRRQPGLSGSGRSVP